MFSILWNEELKHNAKCGVCFLLELILRYYLKHNVLLQPEYRSEIPFPQNQKRLEGVMEKDNNVLYATMSVWRDCTDLERATQEVN